MTAKRKAPFMILLAAAFFAAVAVSHAADSLAVHFMRPKTWAEATKAAKDQQKFLFLDGYTEWCTWCKVMDRETFSDAEVGSLMNARFVNVKMEMESGVGPSVAMKYRIHGFPQFLIFDPDGKLVYRIVGFKPKDAFMEDLKNALDPRTQMSFAGVTTKMDLPYPDFIRKTYLKGRERQFPESEEVDAWLKSYKDLGDEVSWTVMTRATMNAYWQDWILNNADLLSRNFGMEYDDARLEIISGRLEEDVERKDKNSMSENIKLIPESDPRKQRMTAIYLMKMSVAEENWTQTAAMMSNAYADRSIDASVVNEFSWIMYEECDDKQALTSAAATMRLVCQNAGWAEWDTLASLLYKTGDTAAAREAAQGAIDKGLAAGQDVSSTRELLSKINSPK